MIIFLLVAALMLAIALAFVLVPLLRSRRTDIAQISDESSNISIFRAQKLELEDDVAHGLISADERDIAVAELGARVVAEVPLSTAKAADKVDVAAEMAAEKRTWMVALCLAMLLPALAILVYLSFGTPMAIVGGKSIVNTENAQLGASEEPMGGDAAPHAQADAAKPLVMDKQILAMVDSLAKKMQTQPDDAKGWVLLGRSQSALKRYAEAADAYGNAARLLPKDAQVAADYADALAGAQEGRFEGKPYQAILRALKLDANNMKALALAGTAEMRFGNRPAALKYWQKLKTLVVKDSDDYREVESIIAEVSGQAMPAPPMSPPPQIFSASASAPKTASAPVTAAQASVSGAVIVAPALLAKIAAGDTLFVLARAGGGANQPRMPLAILRMPVPKKWPFTFLLTDAMAMMPGMNLSSFPELVVEARISKSGGATLQPGDMAGQVSPVKPGAKDLQINISRLVQ